MKYKGNNRHSTLCFLDFKNQNRMTPSKVSLARKKELCNYTE